MNFGTGLLYKITAEEAEAVRAHEASHVANGDIGTLALNQGAVNSFVLFLTRVIGNLVGKLVFKTKLSVRKRTNWRPGCRARYVRSASLKVGAA